VTRRSKLEKEKLSHDAEKETPAEDQDEEAMSGDECFQDRNGNFWKRGHTVFI